MSVQFNSEVTLIEDPDEGLRIDCQQNHVPPIGAGLTSAGFTWQVTRTAIQGTANLPTIVEVAVAGGTFDDMKQAVLAVLQAAGVQVSEENFSALGEKNIRLTLDNVSMFR